uniref:Uncharacterized protein n=1 Tax=Pyricularia oryzae (strain P131) TaxID=1143193 RepID=L7IQ86_PYRO1
MGGGCVHGRCCHGTEPKHVGKIPWYSQCQPIESGIGQPGNPIVITTTVQKTITVVPGPGPTVITTRFTYLTPSPTLTPDPQFTVIDGVTYSIIRPRTSSAPPQFTVINGITYSVIRPRAADPTVAPAVKARAPHLDDANRNVPRAPAGPNPNTILPRAPTPTVLAQGQYWIRAVAPPNYHKYLQTQPANVAGRAVLGGADTAGQFSIRDGQLVAATGAGEPALYLHVERPAVLTDPPQRALATWFNTTRNDFGSLPGRATRWCGRPPSSRGKTPPRGWCAGTRACLSTRVLMRTRRRLGVWTRL